VSASATPDFDGLTDDIRATADAIRASMARGGMLRADRKERLLAPASYETRRSVASQLDGAAHAMAGLGSPGYHRLARFAAGDARTSHLGASIARRAAEARSRAGAEADAAEASTSRLGGAIARRAGEARIRADQAAAAAAAVPARSAQGMFRTPEEVSLHAHAPRPFLSLLRHMGTIRQAARDGVKDAMLDEDRFFGSRGQSHERCPPARAAGKMMMEGAYARCAAIAAFAQAAAAKRGAATAPVSVPDVAAESQRVRGSTRRASLGVMTTVRIAAGFTIGKAQRLGRFFSDGAMATHIGATETMRRAAGNRHMRLAGCVAAVAGLALFGLGHLPDAHAIVTAASQTAHGLSDQASHIAANHGINTASLAKSAHQFWANLGSALGTSDDGQQLAIISGGTHAGSAANGAANAGATPGMAAVQQVVAVPAIPGGQHAMKVAEHANHVIHGAPHAHPVHHGAPHAHPVHHAAAGAGQGLDGSRTTQALNSEELQRVRAGDLPHPPHASAERLNPVLDGHAPASAHPVHHAAAGTHPGLDGSRTTQALNSGELQRVRAGDLPHAPHTGAEPVNLALDGHANGATKSAVTRVTTSLAQAVTRAATSLAQAMPSLPNIFGAAPCAATPADGMPGPVLCR